MFVSLLITFSLCSANFAFASTFGLSTYGIDLFNPNKEAVSSGDTTQTAAGILGVTVNNTVTIIFGFVALFVFGLVVYSGFVILTSNGDPTAYKKGLNMLQTTLIGLIIVIFSYVLVNFIIANIVNLKTS